ncbi:MAG: hypothetical protein V4557_12370 [Bacteroidota bacterium]
MTTLDLLKNTVTSNIEEYEVVLNNCIAKKMTKREFDELDDYILGLIEKEPFLAKKIAFINLKVSKTLNEPHWVGYTYNTLINSLLRTNSIELVFPYFKEGLFFCITNSNMFRAGHSICSNLNNGFNLLKQDEMIEILKMSIDFYKKYNKNKYAVKNMMQAAQTFSKFGAYQPAYRLISDAELFCIEKKMEQSHVDVIATAASIAMEEGDFSFAEEGFQNSFHYYTSNSKKIPFQHLFNWGTVLIRTKRYPEAEGIYKMIKSNYSNLKDPRIDINLAICYKNQKKYDLAITLLKRTEKKIKPTDNFEWIVEFYIILSSAFALDFQYENSTIYLNKCVFSIEKYLGTVSRFHYRRGIRETYYRRIVDILEVVFPKTSPKNLLHVLVYLKTNSQSDWLAIIDWVEQVNNDSKIDIDDKNVLNTKFKNLVNFGGVIVNSFLEKYDDPFEMPSIDTPNTVFIKGNHLPWQELTLMIQQITLKYSISSPYELNSINKLSTAITEKMKDSVILFVFIVQGKYLVYNISDTKDNVYEIEIDTIINHAVKLNAYRSPGSQEIGSFESAKDRFRTSLESLTFKLSYILNDLFGFIISNKIKTISIIPDVFDSSLPLFATFFSIDELVELFYSGNLTIETIPVLFKSNERKDPIDSASVITNKFNSLDLFEEEGQLLKKQFSPKYLSIMVDDTKGLQGWRGQLKESKCIHIISHGLPISFYKDPSFSALDGESLSLESFQDIFLNSQCDLFVLNACNSADTTNRNFHRFFKSYEAVSYVSVLLQNRKSKIIAAQWPELDTFSYIFTSIFYKKVRTISNIQISFAQTIAEIRKADKPHFLSIIEEIENETVREQKKQMILNAKSSQPFDRVLMFGCLNLYSLL